MKKLAIILALASTACITRSVVDPTPDAEVERAFGSACESDDQCASGYCELEKSDEEVTGGLCTDLCTFGEDQCEEGVCVGNGDSSGEGSCYPLCDGLECREGWSCVYFFANFCVPDTFL